MKAGLRSLAAVLAGVLVLFLLVVAVELFSAVVHPFPPDFGGTEEEMCRHVERYPTWILAVVVPAWAAAAFLSTRVSRIIGNVYASAIVGMLLLAALVFNMSMLPYPSWFEIANLIAIPIAVITGSRISLRRKPTAAGL